MKIYSQGKMLRSVVLALLGLCTVFSRALAYESFAVFGSNTHEHLFDDAKTGIDSGEYPDIVKFAAALRRGSDNEDAHLDARGIIADPELFWFGNEPHWRDRAKTEYQRFDFARAYEHMGFVVHLVQDFEVPAHQKVVYHGPIHYRYRLSPDIPNEIIDGETKLDDLERKSAADYDASPAANFNYDQKFFDSQSGCSSKFWLADSEDADPITTNAGAYGRNADGTCATSSSFTGRDWFADADSIAQTAIYRSQLSRARSQAEIELRARSASLPPLARDLAIGGKSDGSAVVGSSGGDIAFKVLENRKPVVRLFITLDSVSGPAIISSAYGTPGGGVPLTLDAGTSLPWEKIHTIPWDGKLADGNFVSDGPHKLCLRVKDFDGNFSPGTTKVSDCTFVSFIINTAPQMSRSDSFGVDPNSPFEGAANTPATAPILRDPIQTFSFDHLGAPSHVFTIYNSPDFSTPFARHEFAAGTIQTSIKETLLDSDFYAAAIVDSFGLSTTYFFKLDNSAPVTRINNISLTANPSMTAPVMTISGTAQDPVSGISYLRMAKGELILDQSGFVSSIVSGDIDNGIILGTATITAGAKTGTFEFGGLPPQVVHTIGAVDTGGLHSAPPLDVTIAATPLSPSLAVPTEIRGPRTLLGAQDGNPSVGKFLRSLTLTTRMDFPTQSGAIAVYLTGAPNDASEAAFSGVLTDNLPNFPRTFVGSVSGNGTKVLDINRLANGGMSIELEGPDIASSEPGAAPTLVGVSGSIDDFSLRTTPPFLPLEADGTLVPVPAGRNVVVTVDDMFLSVEEITSPGSIHLEDASFAAGTGIETVPPGKAASVDVAATYTGPLTVKRLVREADIPGGNPGNVKFAQYDVHDKFLVLPTEFVVVSPGMYQFSAAAFRASFFPLLIRADGSPVPSADNVGPTSTLEFSGGSYATPEGQVFVSTTTGIVLGATDEFSGVEQKLFAVDHPELTGANFGPATEAAFNAYSTPFTVAEGTRLLSWGAADRARNFGNLQTMTLASDGTPPTTEMSVVGPRVVLSSGEVVVGPSTTLIFDRNDPVSNGVASGVAATIALVDETAASCGLSLDSPPVIIPGAPQGSCGNPFYSTPFNVAAGSHTLGFFSLDNVLNVGVVRSTIVVGDYIPPSVTVISTAQYVSSHRPSLSASFSDSLAGLSTASLRLELDGSTVSASISLPGTGGSLGAWTNAGTLYSPLTGHGFVAYNGWLYAIGGFNGSVVSNQVQFAKINADGSVGPWNAAPSLPEPRLGFAAAAANGTLYVMDGGNGTAGSSVFYAQINADGSLVSWKTGNSLPAALQDTDGVAVIAQDAYLFVIGGYQSDRVYSAPIGAGGAPGTWTLLATRLPKVLRQTKAVALGDRIYLMGGMTSDPLSSNIKDTYIGQVLPGGDVTSWVPGPDLPAAVSYAAAAGADGMILYGGGFLPDGSITDRTFVARVSGAGLSAWEEGPRAPYPAYRPGIAAGNGRYFWSGGQRLGGSIANGLYTAAVDRGPAAHEAVLAGVPAADLDDGQHTLVARGSDAVENMASAAAVFTVDTVPPEIAVTAAGVVLSTDTAAFLPSLRPALAVTFVDSGSGLDPPSVHLTLDGADVTNQASGSPLTFTPSSDLSNTAHTFVVQAADRAGNQSLLTYRFTPDAVSPAAAILSPLDGVFVGTNAVRVEALLFDSGSGLDIPASSLLVDGSSLTATLDFAPVSEGLGAWTNAGTLYSPLTGHGFVAYNGWLYAIGGFNGSVVSNQVQFAKINADGSVGPWNAAPSLPEPRLGFAAAAANGYLYVMDGGNGTAGSSVFYAQINADGSLVSWKTGNSLPAALQDTDGVAVIAQDAYLFVIGGYQSDRVYSAPIGAGGAPGTWKELTTPLPKVLRQTKAVALGDRIYLMGGMTSDPLSSNIKDTYIGQVLPGGDVTSWVPGPDLPAAVSYAAAAGADGMILYGGGFLPDGSITDRTFVARVSGAGLSAWEEGPRAPYPAYRPGIAAGNGRYFWSDGQRLGGSIANGLYTAAVNSGGVALATATADAVGLAEGPHEARAEAADRAGNTAFSSSTFFVDLTPPETRLVVAAASRTIDGGLYVLGVTTVAFGVKDGPEGAASGPAQTLYAVDDATEAPAGAFAVLPPGWSMVHFRSLDAVGNAEVLKSSAVKLDAVAPDPVGDLLGTALSTEAVRLSWTVTGDDGALGDIADGAAAVSFSQDGAVVSSGPVTLVASSGALAAGSGLSWTASSLAPGTLYHAAVYTRDTAGNWSAASDVVGVRTLAEDALPPRTSLIVEGPQIQGERLFIAPQTQLSLSATDDLLVAGDGVGVGVAFSSYSSATQAVFQEFISSFTLAEGLYDLRYFSADRAGHVEDVHLASVAVDGTGPAVALEFHAPFQIVSGTDTVFVQGLGPLAVSATDFPAVSVGVAAVYRSVDGGAAEASPTQFTLQEGIRTLAIWADDLLGNHGSTVTYAIKLDATAPLPVSDLVVTGTSSTTAVVSWTVPGDDGATGDIFDAAIRLDFGPNPASLTQEIIVSSGFVAAGSRFERTFTGLQEGTSYYAVAYTRDTAFNWSTASAVASARTYSVAVAASSGTTASFYSPVPAEITVVSTVTQAEAYAVAIASQGLTPSGGSFFELTSGVPFSSATPAVISFRFTSDSADPLSVFIYTYDTTAMQWSSASIVNQTLTQLSANEYQITGEIYHTSLYAPMVRDSAAPSTAFSVAGSSAVLEGRLFAAGGSSGALTAQDLAPLGGTASGVASTSYRIGSGPDSAYASPFPLPEGDLTLTFRSTDRSGNEEAAKTARLFVDASAPLLAFSVDQATFPVPGGFGTLSATVTVTLSALDPEVNGAASGLASFSALLDGNPVPVSEGLLLGAGLHTLALSAADRLGNAAVLTLKVAVGDTLPPVTTLSVGLPKASLPDGSVLVSGDSVLTLSAEDFAESGAPAGVAQTLYRFGAEAFSSYADAFGVPAPDGAKVLEYYSVDRAGNAEAPKSQALVLDGTPPSAAFTFPRPDEPGLCRLAQGPVQVRGTVSDDHLAAWDLKDGTVMLGSGTRNTQGLLGVWDATGKSGSFALTLSAFDLVENAASASITLAAGSPAKTLALGGKKALNKPRGVAAAPNRVYVADTNSDAVRVYDAAGNLLASFGAGKKDALKLSKPSGLALDAYGNIFVADTGNKRVVKLSPGGFILAEYGGKKVLEKPVAVALAAGKVLAADAHAGELAVFSESGALLQRVSLPPASRGHEDDDEEGEARPMALAADVSGVVWVADAKGGRVLRYDAALNLTETIPGFERPEGLAVSPSGSCLAVVDAKRGDVRTFDAALGTPLAAFASLHKPAQAAFTQDGQLLVAERNEDQVTGFGLPGTPLIVALLQEKEEKEGKQGKGKGFRTGAVEEAGDPPVVARVGRLEGGTVEEPRGGSVELPSGALPEDTDVSVAVAQEAGVAERQALKLAAASAPREFGPHGLAFAAPVTITLPYDPALLAGARPEEVKVHYWNAERGAWEALATRLDPDARTVSAQTTHFSLYQALVPMRVFGVLADPEATFSFRSVYAFPNPAVGGQRPSIHVAVGKADKVVIRIFDIAGTPVHEATLEGSPSVVSDDSGTHYAYEYTWDGHIPSGVYLYTVTAEKAGNAPIKRLGKLAVVR